MAYVTPKENWVSSDAPLPADLNRIEGNTHANHDAIVQEAADRAADVDAEEAARIADVNAEEAARIAYVGVEEAARIAADAAEVTARNTAINTAIIGYTGSDDKNLDYPVGSYVTFKYSYARKLNESVTLYVYTGSSPGTSFRDYTSSGWSAINGVWKVRGDIGVTGIALAQRIS